MVWWYGGIPCTAPYHQKFRSYRKSRGVVTVVQAMTSSFHHYSILSFINPAIVSGQMQHLFNAPLDGDPYGWLFNKEGDNGLSPAHFIFPLLAFCNVHGRKEDQVVS